MGKVGRFGIFGGQYVPETVMNAVHELEEAYAMIRNSWKNTGHCCGTMPADRQCCTMQTA